MAITRTALVMAACVALAGCAGGQKVKAVPQFVKVECKRYSKAEMDKAADELEHYAEQVPQLSDFADDYGSLRAAVCKKQKPPAK